MSREVFLCDALIYNFLEFANPSIFELLITDFDPHLRSKVSEVEPTLASKTTAESNFAIYDAALDALGTLTTKTRLAYGETPEAFALTQLSIAAGTQHLIAVGEAFAIKPAEKIKDPKILAITLKAARHNVISIEDLRQTGFGAETLSNVQMSVLTSATSFLERYPGEVTNLFGRDGKNEIDQIINSRFQRLARSTRPYPF